MDLIKMFLLLASASSFDTSWNGGNMIFIYYNDRAGPTEFIVIKSLSLKFCSTIFMTFENDMLLYFFRDDMLSFKADNRKDISRHVKSL